MLSGPVKTVSITVKQRQFEVQHIELIENRNVLFLQCVTIFDYILNAAHELSVHIVLFNLLVFSEVAVH